MKLNYDVADSPVLSAFIQDWDHKFMGIRGPLGSGKSTACVIKILNAAMRMPPCEDGIRRSKWLIARNTYRELQDTTIKTWLQWVPENHFGPFRKQALTHEIAFNDVQLEVIFRSLDTDDDIRKVLSLELTGAWFNEAREIPWTLIKNTGPRTGRYPVKDWIPHKNWIIKPTKFDEKGKALDGQAYWNGRIADTNSPDTSHWWYTLAETPEEICKDLQGNVDPAELKAFNDAFIFYRQPSGLDPDAENIKNLPASYYTDMILGADRDWVNVYVHNNYGFIIDGKPVFPEYRDDVHCQDVNAVPGLLIIRAWDFGLTPSCTFHQFTAKGQWLIIDEIGSDDMGIDRFSDIVFAKSKMDYPSFNFLDVGDPAGNARAQTDEKTCFEIINNKLEKIHGPNFHPIESGKQDPRLRLEAVRKGLTTMIDGFPGLIISPKAKMTRQGFQGGYQYKKVRTTANRFQEKPDKNQYSHYLDSVQYAGTIFLGSTLTDFEYFQDDDEDITPNTSRQTGRSRSTGY